VGEEESSGEGIAVSEDAEGGEGRAEAEGRGDKMKRQMENAPLWAELAYRFAVATAGMFTRLESWVNGKLYWRYRLYDDYCDCKPCNERRARGQQGPYKGRAKITSPAE
jgi:hypothetical protein